MVDLLSLLPDWLCEMWRTRRFPPLNETIIPSTQAGDIGLGATVERTSKKGLKDLHRVYCLQRSGRG